MRGRPRPTLQRQPRRRKVTRQMAVFTLKELDRVHAAAKALGLEPPPGSEFGDAMI